MLVPPDASYLPERLILLFEFNHIPALFTGPPIRIVFEGLHFDLLFSGMKQAVTSYGLCLFLARRLPRRSI